LTYFEDIVQQKHMVGSTFVRGLATWVILVAAIVPGVATVSDPSVVLNVLELLANYFDTAWECQSLHPDRLGFNHAGCFLTLQEASIPAFRLFVFADRPAGVCCVAQLKCTMALVAGSGSSKC
jgi:hypothetical protein